jgi:hypothetical protein
MFDKLIEGLTNQGALGIMLGLLLLVFVRFFNKTFDAQVDRDKAYYQYMQQTLAALQEIKSSLVNLRSEINASVSAKIGDAEDKIRDAVREIGRFVVDENRRDNDLSRPHSVDATPPPAPRQPYAPAEASSRRVP